MEANAEPGVLKRQLPHARGGDDERTTAIVSGARGDLLLARGAETGCPDILDAQAIRGDGAPTRGADAPAAIKGAVDRRGTMAWRRRVPDAMAQGGPAQPDRRGRTRCGRTAAGPRSRVRRRSAGA